MTKKKIIALLLVLILAFAQMITAFANNLDDKKSEYDDVKQKMQAAEAERRKARAVADEASNQMDEIVGQLSQLNADMEELKPRAEALQKDIDENTEILNDKKEKMEGRLKIYRERLRQIYINGQINYIDVLLGAKDFSDFSSRMFLLQKIISLDLELVETVRREADEIQTRQDQLDRQMAEIRQTEKMIADKTEVAEKVREERARLLYKAEEERRANDDEYDRLAAISENLASMIRSMERTGNMPVQSGTGRFVWPCQGTITSYAGWRTHPIFGTTRYHSGMDIAVPTGTPIVAADNGVVTYSGWMGGYGYTVMVNHGGGLVTLYAHNSSLAVREGQAVQQGQLVAYAGSTGYSTGPHCHFEARLNGEVTDPLNYLP